MIQNHVSIRWFETDLKYINECIITKLLYLYFTVALVTKRSIILVRKSIFIIVTDLF